MAVNKVIYGETTVIDITDSTVTASKLKSGETAYGANGQKVTGTLVVPEVLDDLSDVVITTPQTTQEIYFDGTNWINYGAKIVLTFDDDFKGQTITLTKGQTTITKTAPLDSNTMNLYVNETGLWTISSEISGDIYETEVNVTTFGISFDAVLSSVPPIPEGATVLPTDDISIWLACANITDKSYTTLAEVLADRETFETLIADSNACDYMARSTSWAGSSEGLVPTMTDDTHPSGAVSYSSQYSGLYGYYAFDNNTSHYWSANGWTTTGAWLQYTFDNEISIDKISYHITKQTNSLPVTNCEVQAFVNGEWTTLATETSVTDADKSLDVSAIKTSKVRVIATGDNSNIAVYSLQVYFLGITGNQDAMALIGKYDYCSDKLLSNATWASAITNSEYWDSVISPLVPKLTADSSSVITNLQVKATGYEKWHAFDGNTGGSFFYFQYTISRSDGWVGYDFGTPVRVCKASMYNISNTASIKNCKYQYSDDGTTWVDATELITNVMTGAWTDAQISSSIGAHRYWCAGSLINNGDGGGAYIPELQFYGRASKEVLVPLVPTMTSNTTPSGVCSSSGAYKSSYEAYKAFDRDSTTYFQGNRPDAYSGWVGYEFPVAQKISKVEFKVYKDGNSSGLTYRVVASNDNFVEDVQTLVEQTTVASGSYSDGSVFTHLINDETPYKYVRLYASNALFYDLYYTVIRELQFYQRTVQTNIVHSCANDTIYYMEDGSPVIVATTNSDGDGILDFSLLEDKEYTFYSSVAKNSSNLSNDFSKTIRITKSEFGGTTEMYLMPDTVKTLYWYGYIDDSRIEECTVANGWATNSYGATFNTNDIRLYSASVSQIMGIGTKKAINMSDYTKLTVINNGITLNGGTYGGCGCNATKVTNTENIGSYTTAGVNKKEWDISSKTGNQYLTIADNANTRDLKILAIILE